MGIYSLFKNDEMQGARISSNKECLWYAVPTGNEAQRRGSRFSTGCEGAKVPGLSRRTENFGTFRAFLARHARWWLPLASVVVFLFLAEAVCHVFGLPESDFAFYIQRVDDDLEAPYNVEDRLLMWSHPPGYEKGPVRINSLGLRDREYSPDKPDGVFRILCLGDSCTFGYDIPVEYAYHSVLEDMLNADPVGPWARFEVLNAGVTGYSTEQMLGYLRHRGLMLEPDLVTVYPAGNDTNKRFHKSDAEIMGMSADVFGDSEIGRWILGWRFYRTLRAAVLRLKGPHGDENKVVRVPLPGFVENLLKMERLSHAAGAGFVIINPLVRTTWLPESPMAERYPAYNKAMLEMAEEHGVPLVDLPAEIEVPDDEEEKYFYDTFHLTPYGNLQVAKRLYDCLEKRGTLRR